MNGRKFELKGFVKDKLKSTTFVLQSINRKLFSNEEQIKINIGSGTIQSDGFKNLDFNSKWYGSRIVKWLCLDYNIDLTQKNKFPIKDNSVDVFYSKNLLEHLPDDVTHHIFSETSRCLKEKGILELILPNPNTDNKTYWGFNYNPNKSGHHITHFDKKRIIELAKQFGFKLILFDNFYECKERNWYYRLEKINEGK